jgi:cation diffusion facilitator family transporter
MALRARHRSIGAHFARHPDDPAGPGASGVAHRLLHLITHGGHGPDHALGHAHAHCHADGVAATSGQALRTVWVSVVVLTFTAVLQAVVVVASGSVALLGDSLHNVADALTALPLAVAFVLGRRPPSARYTYGYGRAEDLAGILVVLAIAVSAGLSAWASFGRLLDPAPIDHVGAVVAAGLVGCAGNELVARHRIRVGRRIGSAALVADGLHARSDSCTSLALVVGALGVAAGWPLADPLVGVLITAAIVAVLWSAARRVLHRLMDAVDPEIVDGAREVLARVDGVRRVGRLRLRWIGHCLHLETEIAVDAELAVGQGHAIVEAAERALVQRLPRLTSATLRTVPAAPLGVTNARSAWDLAKLGT